MDLKKNSFLETLMSTKFKEKLTRVLTTVGKRCGINLVYLVKNGSWITLRFFVLAVGGWLVSLCFARLGSKELLGQYQFVLSFISMLAIVSLPGLNMAVLEAIVKGQEGAVIKAVKISFIGSLIGVPLIIAFGFFNMMKGETGIAEALFLVSLLFPLYYALNTWQSYYEGKSLFKQSSWRLMLLNLVLFGALILGLVFNIGLQGLIFLFFGIHVLFFVFYFKKVFSLLQDRRKDNLDVRFGVRVSVQKCVFGLSSTLPPIAISFIFGVESLAVYYIASYMITAIFAFLGTLSSLYLPILFRGLNLNHRNILWQNAFIGVISWIAFVLFLKFLFIAVYGEEYRESLSIAYGISFLLFLIPLKTYLMGFFMTQKKNWILIQSVSLANIVAFSFFYFTREGSFASSITVYLYALELLTTLPLLAIYFRDAFIRHEQ